MGRLAPFHSGVWHVLREAVEDRKALAGPADRVQPRLLAGPNSSEAQVTGPGNPISDRPGLPAI